MRYNCSCIKKNNYLSERSGGTNMDFANRGNRPNAQAQQQSAPINQQEQLKDPSTSSFKPSTPKKQSRLDFGKISSLFMLITVTLLAFVLVLGLIFFSNGSQESDAILTGKYQAVFLDSQDGQVYFGKMGVYNKDMYVLTDIYYVRVENPIQPQGTEAQQPNISLAKLGSELHGPQDVMYISRDKVLYWENLKDDGQVVTAITKFKADGGETSTPANDAQQGAEQSQAAPNNAGAGNASGTQPADAPEQNDTPGDTTDPVLEP